MSSQVAAPFSHDTVDPQEFESLYFKLLKAFYRAGDFDRARTIGQRLERILQRVPAYADSIRGEEVRSLIAEANGNLDEAIQSRQAEIRKILELHAIAANTSHWNHVSQTYGFDDVSDRLDLLAILFDGQGSLRRAIETLVESKRYCASHGIAFDADDLLDELKKSASTHGVAKHSAQPDRDSLDDAVRHVYRRSEIGVDRVVANDALSKRFTGQVNRMLGSKGNVTVEEIRSRLLALRKRSEHSGGLPRRTQ